MKMDVKQKNKKNNKFITKQCLFNKLFYTDRNRKVSTEDVNKVDLSSLEATNRLEF
jgi:hypothetical protein